MTRRSAFTLATVKGFTGHQESGAGVAGIMEAALLVQHASVPPALHLRHLNPHVRAPLAAKAVAIARGGPHALPLAAANRRLAVGVSSFGAQGTNAHALVGGAASHATVHTGAVAADPQMWRRSYCWVAPRAHVLVGTCTLRRRLRAGKGKVTFETNLAVPALAYLWGVHVDDTPCLMGATLLAVAAAGARLMTTHAHTTALVHTSLVGPQPLPRARPGASPASLVLSLSANVSTGALEVSLLGQNLLSSHAGAAPAPNSAAMLMARADPVPPEAAPSTLGSIVAIAITSARDYQKHLGTFATLSGADGNEAGMVQPTVLESCLAHALFSSESDAAGAGAAWVRSVSALSMGMHALAPGDPCVYATRASERTGPAWTPGMTVLSGGAAGFHMSGVTVGSHHIAASAPTQNGVADGAAEARSEDTTGLAADNPLLQMSEEERTLFLQAQVGLWVGSSKRQC